MAQEWITDRRPTAADGDQDGDVRMVPAPGADLDDYVLAHWSYVGDAAPWQHTSLRQPTADPDPVEPTEPDRIAALEQRVAELEAMVRPSAEPPAEWRRLPTDHCIRLDRACLGD
jgi:hypothetical protein